MAEFTVAFYEIDRAYGGPEEGGWWYSTGHLERMHRVFKCEEAAYECARRANRLLEVVQRGKRDLDSVTYCGGRFAAEVHEGLPPQHYPETRPFYE